MEGHVVVSLGLMGLLWGGETLVDRDCDMVFPSRTETSEADYQAFWDDYPEPFMAWCFEYSGILGEVCKLMPSPQDTPEAWAEAAAAVEKRMIAYEALTLPTRTYCGSATRDAIRKGICSLDIQIRKLLQSRREAFLWMEKSLAQDSPEARDKADQAMEEGVDVYQEILELGRSIPTLFEKAREEAETGSE